MGLVADRQIVELVSIAERLRGRIDEWFDATDVTVDKSLKIPDQRIRDCIGQVARITMDVARLDMERARLSVAKAGKGHPDLTDEQYEAGMAKLRAEAMQELSTSELAMEIDRRSRMES